MIRTAAAGAALAFAAFGSAGAQAPALDDPEATYVQELVVKGRLPGPAWWRVSDEDTVVYVLGVPDALPKGQTWDQSVLKRRLQGANMLITPPVIQASANMLAVPGLLISARRAMGEEAAPGEGLTPEQIVRLEAAASAARVKADRYAELRPWMAAVRFAEDHRERMGLDGSEPVNSVRRLAKAAKVKTQPAIVRKMKAKTLIAEVKQVPPAAGRACFDAVMAEIANVSATRSAAVAWASGDPKVALGAPRSSERCLVALPGAADEVRNVHRGQADAIEKALQTPGHAVATLSLRSLLAEGGTLAQLRARGYQVRAPE